MFENQAWQNFSAIVPPTLKHDMPNMTSFKYKAKLTGVVGKCRQNGSIIVTMHVLAGVYNSGILHRLVLREDIKETSTIMPEVKRTKNCRHVQKARFSSKRRH